MQGLIAAVSQTGFGRRRLALSLDGVLRYRVARSVGVFALALLALSTTVQGQEADPPQSETARINGRWNGSDKQTTPAIPAAANGVVSITPDTAEGRYSITPANTDDLTQAETLSGAPPQPPAGMLSDTQVESKPLPMTLTAAPNAPSLVDNAETTAGRPSSFGDTFPAFSSDPSGMLVDPSMETETEGDVDPNSGQSMSTQFPAPAPSGFGQSPAEYNPDPNGFGTQDPRRTMSPQPDRNFSTPPIRGEEFTNNGLRPMETPPRREQAGAWGASQPPSQSFGNQPGISSNASDNSSPGFSGSVRTLQADLPAYPEMRMASGATAMSDPRVAPTTYLNASPSDDSQQPQASLDQVRERFQSYATTGQSSLPGQPVQLVEMMLEPLPYQQRREMVSQYWETYYDWASLVLAQRQEKWLASVRSSTSQADTTLLQLARQVAANRRLAAEIQLGKSQSRLLDFMANPRPSGFLPLPADQPLISSYRTDFAVYQKYRQLPSSLRGIDEMLPKTLTLIRQRAATASSAQYATQQLAQSAAGGQSPLSSVLQVGQVWYESDLALVASVINYNQAIGDYILSVEPNRPPGSLVGLMIGAPANRTSPTNLLGNVNPPERQARLADVNTGQSILSQAPRSNFGSPSGPPAGQTNPPPTNNGFGQPLGGSPANRTAPPAAINQFPGTN